MRIALTFTGALLVALLVASQTSATLKNRTKSNNANERVDPVEPSTAEPSQTLKNRTKSNSTNERDGTLQDSEWDRSSKGPNPVEQEPAGVTDSPLASTPPPKR